MKIEVKHCKTCNSKGTIVRNGLTPQYPIKCQECNGTGHIVTIKDLMEDI